MKKHLRARRFKSHDDVKHEVQTWLRGQDPPLLSTGFWEMDFPPRQVPQQRRWLCGKI